MEPSTLVVRHLPSELSAAEKDDFLRHFGATSVRLMGTAGPMKHTAFAGFPDHLQANKALSRLHQLYILGSTLKVEFSKESLAPDRAKGDQPWVPEHDEEEEREKKFVPSSDDDVLQRWSIDYPRNPKLHYLYPPPTVSILTNIANALASYPKFYVQVLHLMNKMNLPAPFGLLTAMPPISADAVPEETKNVKRPKSSSSESEIESEEENTSHLHLPNPIIVRKKKRVAKKARLAIPPLVDTLQTVPPEQSMKPSEVFEQAEEGMVPKKITLNLPGAVAKTVTHSTDFIKPGPPKDESSGFGRIEPVLTESESGTVVEEDDWVKNGFISDVELDMGRMSPSKLKDLSVFRRYEKGEPSCRLYLKNLSKQVSENNLRFIYGHFIDVTSQNDMNIFDIRLMKEGKMKGQAFVTLPTEEKARRALQKTNGFELFGKPIAVQYARSAKQKPN